jgi:hypothetical protein
MDNPRKRKLAGKENSLSLINLSPLKYNTPAMLRHEASRQSIISYIVWDASCLSMTKCKGFN